MGDTTATATSQALRQAWRVRAIVGTCLIASVYLQRVAIPGTGLAVATILLVAGTAAAVAFGMQELSVGRLWFGIAVLVLGSAAIVGDWAPAQLKPSVLSLLLLVLLWGPFVLLPAHQGSHNLWLSLFFQRIMVLPAGLAVWQLVAEFSSVVESPPDILASLPAGWLVPGYQEAYEFTYGLDLFKSTGVVFLESSFASQFFALAALLALRRNRAIVGLFVLALVATGGGTGIVIFLVGAIVESARGASRQRMAVLVAISMGLAAMSLIGLSGVILDRAGEVADSQSSASIRFVSPYVVMVEHLRADPVSLAFGSGPGTAEAIADEIGRESNAPLPSKLAIEYGVVLAAIFTVGLLVLIARLPVTGAAKVGIALMFMALSGALLQPHTSLFLWALYMAGGRDPSNGVLALKRGELVPSPWQTSQK